MASRPPIDIRVSITSAVNDSIVRMKTIGKLRVLKRDRAMERPPTTSSGSHEGSEGGGGGPVSTSAWLSAIAAQWSEKTVDASPGHCALELPPSLVELYTAMSSNGISFIGRHEAPSVAAIDKLFPSVELTSCGPVARDVFTIPNPHKSSSPPTPNTVNPPPASASSSSSSAAASSSSFSPVCMCHLNAIQRITPVTLAVDARTAVGIPTVSPPRSSVAFAKEAAPLETATDRYFTLWAGDEGAAPAHSNCTAGDGIGFDILLRYSKHHKTNREPEVWGFVPSSRYQQQSGNNKKAANGDGGEDEEEGTLFFISKTFFDFVRIGCLRFCWGRMWPLLLAPSHVRAAYGLLDAADATQLTTMRPWLELFSNAPIPSSTEGVEVNSVMATKRTGSST